MRINMQFERVLFTTCLILLAAQLYRAFSTQPIGSTIQSPCPVAAVPTNEAVAESRFFSVCMEDMAVNMPLVPGTQIMKTHHWDAQTGKWNELDRWQPMPLTQGSTVFYVGANTHGEDGKRLVSDYGCHIHVFEPVPSFFAALSSNWAGTPKSTLHNFGLGGSNRSVVLPVEDVKGQSTFAMESSGSASKSRGGEVIQIKDADAVIKGIMGGKDVALLHINCEGCEWEMLERILETGTTKSFQLIQIGTHWFSQIDNIQSRYCKIREGLHETHDMEYGQIFGWERWKRRV